jgi:hypothetical protein
VATPKRSKKLSANCQELLTLGVESAEFRAEGGIFRRWRIRRPPPADNKAENPSRYGGRLRNFELKVGFSAVGGSAVRLRRTIRRRTHPASRDG